MSKDIVEIKAIMQSILFDFQTENNNYNLSNFDRQFIHWSYGLKFNILVF